jgi:hypothetical protein
MNVFSQCLFSIFCRSAPQSKGLCNLGTRNVVTKKYKESCWCQWTIRSKGDKMLLITRRSVSGPVHCFRRHLENLKGTKCYWKCLAFYARFIKYDHKCLPLFPTMSYQTHPHLTPCSLKISPQYVSLEYGYMFPSYFPTKILHAFLKTVHDVKCSAQLIHTDMIAPIKLGEELNPLGTFLRPPHK